VPKTRRFLRDQDRVAPCSSPRPWAQLLTGESVPGSFDRTGSDSYAARSAAG
jgi:hypothetical protein